MTWADPIADNSTAWSGIGFLNQLVRALDERREAVGLAPSGLEVEEGDDVQAVSFIRGLQQAALDVLERFQDPDTMDVTPGSIPANFAADTDWSGDQYTEQTAMDAAGLSDGFTRKRPREIEALDDAGANGQVARYIGEDDDGDFKIYTHDGSSWSLASDQTLQPDTIEVDSAFPRLFQAGDYIGPWIWIELQDLLQVARVVVYGHGSPAGFSGDYTESDQVQEGSTAGSTYPSSAAAITAAEADWDDGTPIGSSNRPAKFSALDFTGATSSWRAWLYARRRTYTQAHPSGDFDYTQTAEIVSKPLAYGHFNATFEDFDRTMVEGQYHRFDSGDFNDGDELVIGGDTSQPTWEDDSDGNEGWGWTSGTAQEFRVTIVNVFTWEFD
jgi:hypothetical protein